jgi:hypothetical protein
VRVFPDAEVLGTDAAFGGDGSRLGKNQRGASDCATAQVHKVPIGRKAILAGILAHRGYDNTILKRNSTNRKRIKGMGHDLLLGFPTLCDSKETPAN